MDSETRQEMLDNEYARVVALDAARDIQQQFRASGAITLLIEDARETAIAALDALVRCDPFKPEIVRELQWRVRRYDMLCAWVLRVIEGGEAATEDLSAEQSAELDKLLRGDEAEPKDA